ncbi:hypothetical protein [Citrobacter phage Tr1]|nr:hypothetical protein [Citrobacter phage Tr1]
MVDLIIAVGVFLLLILYFGIAFYQYKWSSDYIIRGDVFLSGMFAFMVTIIVVVTILLIILGVSYLIK